jgi:hypothetical protein
MKATQMADAIQANFQSFSGVEMHWIREMLNVTLKGSVLCSYAFPANPEWLGHNPFPL